MGAPLARTSSKRPRATRTPPSADPLDAEFVMPRVRYPLQGGIRPRSLVIVLLTDTLLLTNLANHPLTSVRRCKVLTHHCMFLYMISCMIFLYKHLFPIFCV